MIAKTFFPQTDPKAEDACAWTQLALDMGIQVVAAGISMGVGSGLMKLDSKDAEAFDKFLKTAGPFGEPRDATSEEKLSNNLRSFYRTSGVNNVLGLANTFFTRSIVHRPLNVGPEFDHLYNTTVKLLNGDLDDLNVGLSGGGICAAFGANRPNENFDHFATLEYYIGNHFTGLREMMLGAMESTVDNLNLNESTFADIFDEMSWSTKLSQLRNGTRISQAES